MKKIMFVLTVCGSALCVSAQNNVQATPSSDGTILVRKSDLPAEVLQGLQSKQQLAEMSQKIEIYGKWVGIGKELGVAVNESLSALTTQADKFAQTGVGKFTMFMVAYKVLGNDATVLASNLIKKAITIPIGICIIAVGTWACVRSLRRMCWGYSMLESIGPDKKKTYKYVEPTMDDRDYITISTAFHGAAYGLFVWAMWAIFIN